MQGLLTAPASAAPGTGAGLRLGLLAGGLRMQHGLLRRLLQHVPVAVAGLFGHGSLECLCCVQPGRPALFAVLLYCWLVA